MSKQVSNDTKEAIGGLLVILAIFILLVTVIATCTDCVKSDHTMYTYEILDKNEAITSKFLVFGTKTKYIVTLKNTTTGEVFTTDIDEREFYTWEVGYTFRRHWYSEEDKLRNKN
nr:MAG TPA: hypothetical protein [Caudoviricetes sp.]